jgi:hypothetical protein
MLGKTLCMGVRLCVLFDPRHHHYRHNRTYLKCTTSRSDSDHRTRLNTRLHDLSYTTRPFKALDESTRASPYGLLMTSVQSFLLNSTLVYHTTSPRRFASALEPHSYFSTDFDTHDQIILHRPLSMSSGMACIRSPYSLVSSLCNGSVLNLFLSRPFVEGMSAMLKLSAIVSVARQKCVGRM